MPTKDDVARFTAYATAQVAAADTALAAHLRDHLGLCACGRPWPCREVLWWTWVRNHYGPLLSDPPVARAPLARPYVNDRADS